MYKGFRIRSRLLILRTLIFVPVVQLKEINCLIKQFLSKLLNKRKAEKGESLLKGAQFSFNAKAYLFPNILLTFLALVFIESRICERKLLIQRLREYNQKPEKRVRLIQLFWLISIWHKLRQARLLLLDEDIEGLAWRVGSLQTRIMESDVFLH